MEQQPRGRRLDPKAASMAGFLSPHSGGGRNSSTRSTGSSTGSGSGSGNWKARLKERCLTRVRQERERLVQGMRGLASPPPPPPSIPTAAEGTADGASRPFLPSPPPVLVGTPFFAQQGNGNAATATTALDGRRPSTPSSLSDAALSILQDEMRAARRGGGQQQQQQQQQEFGEAREGAMMAIAEEGEADDDEEEGEEEEEEQLSPEEHWELMRCIEEALALEARAGAGAGEEWTAGEEYSQLEHADVEGAVAQLYDYEAIPEDDVAVLCPRCKANYLLPPHNSRPGSSASNYNGIGSLGDVSIPIVCACGLHMEPPPGTGLCQLQERLAAVYGHHRASSCPVRDPAFYQRELGRDLWVECGACGLNAQVV